jgi:hypothetical protein
MEAVVSDTDELVFTERGAKRYVKPYYLEQEELEGAQLGRERADGDNHNAN